jgi:Tripartite tricarboxylate transporter TctB family.
MFFKRYGNLVVGLFFAVVSVVYFFVADSLPKSTVMRIGPDFTPKVIAVLTFVISVVLAVLSWRTLRATPAPEAVKSESEYGRVLLTILTFAVYVFLFESLGFPLMTFLYLAAQMAIFAPAEKRNIPLFLGISLVATLAIFYTFRNGLSVFLPPGVFKGILA